MILNLLWRKDLEGLRLWSKNNFVTLYYTTCFIITFSRKRNWMYFDYVVSGTKLNGVYFIRDLGVVLVSSLNCKNHINSITALAYKRLAFVIRTCSVFNSLEVHLILYNSLVRFVSEYNSLVWPPKSKVLTNQIKKVQKKFLR